LATAHRTLGAAERLAPSPGGVVSRYAVLATAAALATYLLIVVGGLVRATDSGLGCPDWPLCFGAWVPPEELHAWIEHSHRLVAAVAVGPLVGATALATVVTSRRHDRTLLVAALLAGALVVAQSLLGAAVVLQQLRAELVTAHLAMALAVLAVTVVIAERASRGPLPAATSGWRAPRWLALAAAAVFVQMLLGSWVSGTNAGLAYPDFPTMGGGLWPAVSGEGQLTQLLHRTLAVVVVGLVLAAAWQARRTSPSGLTHRLAAVAALLVLIQVAIGAANVWTRLSALAVVPHLAVGAALWAILVWLYLALRRAEAGA